jgi:hypothetical protein
MAENFLMISIQKWEGLTQLTGFQFQICRVNVILVKREGDMPKLTQREIEIHYNPVRGWEDTYGVDWPCCYLPYWVGYMPDKAKIKYLAECKGEFIIEVDQYE